MKYLYSLKNFAAEYNCGAYGEGDYNSSVTCETLTGGSLSDTGVNVYVGVVGGLVIMAVAVFLIFRKAKKK